ncbi:Transposon TX1 uncharacterized 82 kDa protein ORF 1 [Takifugu flavidus]|uniref:Transposon TX1 uncharacterized 82 kDa protein ORF 1 n=1 Tax=Takifugu flavidus TaxID=433684 RepID=A0A5C6P2F3_9TELE|nr:Transposon TX1 uncharacterized 82 kDa protein ORF 1 [Takifugu flavidus]
MAANANLTGLSRRHGVKVGAGSVLSVEEFVQVTPLTQPAAWITLSNVPPFISDEFLAKELSRHGKLVSQIRKLLSGYRSPLLRHVVSHRRQVHMILNNKVEEFNYRFVVRVDDFDYILFATSSALKCFNCGEEVHLARACPSRRVLDVATPAAESAVPDPAAPRPRGLFRRRGVGGAVRVNPALSQTDRKWSRRRRGKGVSVCM